jgi:histidinol dehydrogenase
MISLLNSASVDFEKVLARLLAYEATQDKALVGQVSDIIADVRVRGDAALLDYTARWDRWTPSSAASLEIPRAELIAALHSLETPLREALEIAAARIRSYHEHQLAQSWSYTEASGTRLGQTITALDRVGLYVPGGKAAYPSSVLMNAIPAKVAGVGELIMVVPTPGGERNLTVLAAAAIAGVDRLFAIGGAQAVAALAYGTASIPAVDKITGPGNAYVAEGKRQVFGQVGIDMIAGPSEILVLCDGDVSAGANADWVAMDLFSQAEHDEMAQAILLCPNAQFIEAVRASIARLLPTMPRRDVIAKSLADRGALILVKSMEQACEITNRIAPEHLEIIASNPQQWADRIRHAGAMFLGAYASESLGDYCAGPNHVLPTMRTSRFSSPLGVYDFQKRSSLIDISQAAAQELGPIAATLATSEGLQAHAQSAQLRLTANMNSSSPLSQNAGSLLAARVLRADVLQMHAYAVPDATGYIKLDAMENPYGLPARLQEELGKRLAAVAMNRYPVPSYASLKAALRKQYAIPGSASIVLGNGSDELITMLATAVARPGASILAPEPGFVMYKMSAQQSGCRFVGVPLAAKFALDREAMLAAIAKHQPALVYLAYPNNPTGNCWNEADMQALVDAAPGIVVIDEAYQPFAVDTWMDKLSANPKLIVMRTVSKMGLAGVRLGYMAGAPGLLDQIEKIRPPYNVNVLTEAAALFSLEHAQAFDDQATLLREQRSLMLAALPELAQEVFESRANFVLVRFRDAAAVFTHLKVHKILVKNVSPMHASLHNCLRLNVSSPEENQALLAALRSAPAAIR